VFLSQTGLFEAKNDENVFTKATLAMLQTFF
jgi:hypothetical protein